MPLHLCYRASFHHEGHEGHEEIKALDFILELCDIEVDQKPGLIFVNHLHVDSSDPGLILGAPQAHSQLPDLTVHQIPFFMSLVPFVVSPLEGSL